jgi:DNA repair protein RadD
MGEGIVATKLSLKKFMTLFVPLYEKGSLEDAKAFVVEQLALYPLDAIASGKKTYEFRLEAYRSLAVLNEKHYETEAAIAAYNEAIVACDRLMPCLSTSKKGADLLHQKAYLFYNQGVCYRMQGELKKEKSAACRGIECYESEAMRGFVGDDEYMRKAFCTFNYAAAIEAEDAPDEGELIACYEEIVNSNLCHVTNTFFTKNAWARDFRKAVYGVLRQIAPASKELPENQRIANAIVSTGAKPKGLQGARKKRRGKGSKPAPMEMLDAPRVVKNNTFEAGVAALKKKLESPNAKLWAHQSDAMQKVSDALEENPDGCRGYLNMATGTGKTITYLSIVNAMRCNTLIVVPTSVLVEQTVSVYEKTNTDLNVGVWDSRRKRVGRNVTVTTYASLQRELAKVAEGKPSRLLAKTYGCVVLDEAHSALSEKRAEGFEQLFALNPRSLVLGCTATPEFNTKRSAGAYKKVSELLPCEFKRFDLLPAVEKKILAPFRILHAKPELELDLSGLRKKFAKKNHADYTDDELKKVLNRADANTFVADMVAHAADPVTKRRFLGQSGVVFAAGIDHASGIAAAINETTRDANYARVIHGGLSKDEQERLLRDHASGKIKILCNADILTVGYDCPIDSFAIDCRPSKSKTRKLQVFGRILRKNPADANKLATFIEVDWDGLSQESVSTYIDGVTAKGGIPEEDEDADMLEPASDAPIFYELISPEGICHARGVRKRAVVASPAPAALAGSAAGSGVASSVPPPPAYGGGYGMFGAGLDYQAGLPSAASAASAASVVGLMPQPRGDSAAMASTPMSRDEENAFMASLLA